jgi:hypothetical protein
MQEFAQKDSATPEGHCPSAEDLAAYIDGNLGKEESQRITEHLASCEDCYAVYTETLRFQLDTESVFAESEVLPFRAPKEKRTGAAAVRRWFPLAALLLVGISGAGWYFLASPPALKPSVMTASLQGKPGLTKDFWLGPTTRGPGDEEEKRYEEASFQMGVQLVNLQLSLEANDAEKARGDILPRIRQVLDTQPLMSPLTDSFAALSADLESKAPREILGKAAQVAHDSRDYLDEPYLDLGQWVEAGRLAALAHNPSFFQQGETRSFLRRFRWREKLGMGDTKLDPVSRESLDQISGIVSKGDLQAPDYAELRRQFEKILEIYYPET